jgi:hypothetical protein
MPPSVAAASAVDDDARDYIMVDELLQGMQDGADGSDDGQESTLR